MQVIEVEGISKSYGATTAVDDVSFSVGEGEIFGVVGPNGAGKTTTVEAVAGLREVDAGRISVLGLGPDSRRQSAAPAVGDPAPGRSPPGPSEGLDLRMAGGDGVTATKAITTARPKTHVLVLTTYDADSDILLPSRPAPSAIC